MRIALAADHGGFPLKEQIKMYLQQKNYEVLDLGCDSEDSVDYPEYGKRCAEAVVSRQAEKGVVVCGTGIGISIAANKVKGIRCALCTSVEMAEMTRKHNDANMLALGGRILDQGTALLILETWLNTEFEGGRHQHRVDLLNEM